MRYVLGDCAFDPFREGVEIGEHSGCPVHISHYFANIALRGQTAKMLQLVDEARASGVDLTCVDCGSTISNSVGKVSI